MLVALRSDHHLYTVFRDVSIEKGYYNGILINNEGKTINLDDYTNDLMHNTNSDLDIVRIYLKSDYGVTSNDFTPIKLVYEVPPIERMSFKDALLVDGRMKPNMQEIPSGFECFQTPRIVLDKLSSVITTSSVYRRK